MPAGRGGARRSKDEAESRDPEPEGGLSGKWIWLPGHATARNFYIYARKTFDLEAKPTRAVLKASADSRYILYVNGRRVGRGPVRGQAGNTYFDTYEIDKLLRPGRNAIAFLVHHYGERNMLGSAGRPGLICRAEIECEGGGVIVETDETWLVCRTPDWRSAGELISPDIGFQEVYDFSRYITDWNDVRCDEREWQNAEVVAESDAEPWGKLIPRAIPQLKENRIRPKAVVGVFNSPERGIDTYASAIPDLVAHSELSPLRAGSAEGIESLTTGIAKAEIRTPRGGRGVVVILDMGREVFGHVEIGLSSGGRGMVDMAYGERLEDGRVKPNKDGARHTDRVLMARGRCAWESFEPRAFRYLQVEFRRFGSPVEIEAVNVVERLYPLEERGTFECSDRALNEIWKLGVQTARLCAEDVFIDSPLTRRMCWPDTRILSRVAYYAFGDTELLAQSLRQIAATQRASGAIPGFYPVVDDEPVLDFALSWVFSILDYYAFSDDVELVIEFYPAVRRLMDWFGEYVAADGLLGEVPGDVFIDRADIERHGSLTALNCLYYQALQIAGFIAALAGQAADASEFIESAHRLRFAINKQLYVPRRGLYAEGRLKGELIEKFSRQANVLAVLFDIPDHYQKATIVRQLSGANLPEITTPRFASHYLEALYATDGHEEALSFIRRKWGAMVNAGATTLWEYFNEQGGLCHGSAASPARDLLAEIVGIKPIPGSHRFAITPHPADLSWAKGSVATKHGPLKVDWRATRSSVTINIRVPEGVRVDVYPPGGPETTVTLDGKHWPSRFVTLGAGMHMVRVTAAKPTKPATLDESLRPIPLLQVEILGEVSPIRRRRTSSVDLRPRTRYGRRSTRQETGRVPKGKPVTVEPRAPVPTDESAPPAAETAPKKRTRRGTRGGRSRAASQVKDKSMEMKATEPAQPATAAESPKPDTATEQQPEKKRRRTYRRGSRGGRSRKPSEQPGSEPEAS